MEKKSQIVVAGDKWAVIFQEWTMIILNKAYSYSTDLGKPLEPGHAPMEYAMFHEYFYHMLPESFEICDDSELPMMTIVGQRWTSEEYQFKVRQFQEQDMIIVWNQGAKSLTCTKLPAIYNPVC